MTPNQLRDIIEHQEALRRFGGLMPRGVCRGSDNIATKEPSEICKHAQKVKIVPLGRGASQRQRESSGKTD